MIVYSIIMFSVAVLFLIIGIEIYKGKTNLIHDYHQKNIQESDLLKYGKDFSKGMFSICATLLVSGLLTLLGESSELFIASMIVLFVGLAISITIFIIVQKKYNGGIF